MTALRSLKQPFTARAGLGSTRAGEAERFVAELHDIVGARHLLTTPSKMRRYTRGYRFGSGSALAVALPGTLVELWRVVERCVDADTAIVLQAANTGLTGGSTPFGEDYDRPVVVIGTMRIKALHLLGEGRQVVAFPGTTLDELEKALKPLGREPHSVIGSSCLGASVIGGIANNSGGSLIRRGPAYTELALYARVGANGRLELVNHLGIDLGEAPAEILSRLDRHDYGEAAVDWQTERVASDPDYATHVRDIDAPSPARHNADPRRLFEASGSAGKLVVFAVRLDTFEAERNARVFYVGTNDPNELTRIRREMLASSASLPVAAEYIHREAFDISERYGKDIYLLVRRLGTQHLPKLFSLKSRFDALAERLPFIPANLSDRLMQGAASLFGPHLPPRLTGFRDRFEHHLMIKAADSGAEELRRILSDLFPSAAGDFFECTPEEGAAAFLHRFATAGAAVRYDAVKGPRSGGVIALDVALARNERDWVEHLPPALSGSIAHRLYYGHFFCHVFHQDYLLHEGVDWHATKREMLALMDKRNARYPAEHNVGHLYEAGEVLAGHYRELDPCNCFNPGIGKTSKLLRWRRSGHSGASSPA
ncbi:D-lactate dehydrogenase [Aureimonas psammosilenae]|uniref:D-lactate dehydrogenase n=1 Tax=Aureimonas psammosilenae TaxID=2495496 RepID=UPI0022A67924|nr:D-lactate dehydrogenase [Aureimonas psammosilenae]